MVYLYKEASEVIPYAHGQNNLILVLLESAKRLQKIKEMCFIC